VSAYLQHQKIQKATWLTSRKVTALGFGIDGLPGEIQDLKNPPARLELLVFVPQN
jgi:hypothetical protein